MKKTENFEKSEKLTFFAKICFFQKNEKNRFFVKIFKSSFLFKKRLFRQFYANFIKGSALKLLLGPQRLVFVRIACFAASGSAPFPSSRAFPSVSCNFKKNGFFS